MVLSEGDLVRIIKTTRWGRDWNEIRPEHIGRILEINSVINTRHRFVEPPEGAIATVELDSNGWSAWVNFDHIEIVYHA